ncbi:hypothetical protein U5N28_16480 [Lysinibacillus telephonicus]|uniref:hypothetical protein n=1 Tax=Lysinibacillus telephonicus TaxID=1714840 RepID=UPI00397D89B1
MGKAALDLAIMQWKDIFKDLHKAQPITKKIDTIHLEKGRYSVSKIFQNKFLNANMTLYKSIFNNWTCLFRNESISFIKLLALLTFSKYVLE